MAEDEAESPCSSDDEAIEAMTTVAEEAGDAPANDGAPIIQDLGADGRLDDLDEWCAKRENPVSNVERGSVEAEDMYSDIPTDTRYRYSGNIPTQHLTTHSTATQSLCGALIITVVSAIEAGGLGSLLHCVTDVACMWSGSESVVEPAEKADGRVLADMRVPPPEPPPCK